MMYGQNRMNMGRDRYVNLRLPSERCNVVFSQRTGRRWPLRRPQRILELYELINMYM